MPGVANIGGIITGLQTNDIIDKMMQLAQAPVTRLQTANAQNTSKLTAWQDLNTRLLALKVKADILGSGTAFQATSLSSSDTEIIGGTSRTTAQAGTYFLTVNTLAQTQQLKTQGFADTDTATIGSGTISLGAGLGSKTAANYLAGTVSSVRLAANTALAVGSQDLVIDAVGTSASQGMSAAFLGADEATARLASAGPAGTITINGEALAFDGSQTLGQVVDAINGKTTVTGVTATITGTADDWHVTLANQSHGSDKRVTYAEDATLLNGGSSNDYDIAGTDASGHIGAITFDRGKGDVLTSAAGDSIVLDAGATTGTKTGAFEVQGKTSITVDSSNNTLSALAAAINRSDSGVTAAIINDGTSTAPYHLILTSGTSGTVGSIVLDTDHLSGGTAPVFTTLQAARDASITLGSGAGAISVTKSTNTVDDLIPGVTLNLNGANPEEAVTVTISHDTQSVKQNIQNLVDQFNNLSDFFNAQFSWDSQTNSGGVLFGDARLQNMQSDLRSIVSGSVFGLTQSTKVLSQIGITSTADGKLTIDDGKLSAALSTHLADVQRLFAAMGDASNRNVSYVAATDKTKPSSTNGYAVAVTALASKSRVTAGVAQTSALAQDETLTINGVQVALTTGMTEAEVIATINDSTDHTGVVASATLADGSGVGHFLTFTQTASGSSKHITVVSNVSNGGHSPVGNTSGLGTLQATEINPFGESSTGTSAAGTDLHGTINGEAATGDGDFLTGNAGNANTEGLKIKVSAASIGSYGVVSFTTGIASVLGSLAGSSTDTLDGAISSAEKGVQAEIDRNNTDITSLQTRLADQRDRLVQQFADMESAIGKLQAQGQYLAAQISGLPQTSK